MRVTSAEKPCTSAAGASLVDRQAHTVSGKKTSAMSLTSGLHRTRQQQPERVVTWFGDRQRTYGEMADRVARIAAVFTESGVKAGDRIAMLGVNSDRYLEFYLASWWAGAIASPVNTRWSAAEIVYSLNDAGTRVLLVDRAFLHLVPEIEAQTQALETILFFDDGAAPIGMPDLEYLIEHAAPAEDVGRQRDDPAVIFYTGGTTGVPKGVVLSHFNLWAAAMSRMAMSWSSPDAVGLHVAPLFHVAAAGRMIAHTLIGGAAVIVPSFRPDEVIAIIERHAVADVVLIPSMLQMLLAHPDFDPARLKSLRRITYGGSAISESVLDQALSLLPDVEFIQSYGMTEAVPPVTLNPHESHVGEGRKLGRLRSAGRAIYGVQLKIVDEQGRETAPGVAGEIVTQGPNVMLGYWGKPEETAKALRGGWLHTGDGGYLDQDGYLYVVDRLKDMIITGGENVYPAEVENAIARHEAVAANAVIGIPSDTWGEGVHAVVVLKHGAALTLAELQAHCKGLIAGYKCPKSVEFKESLPMSPVGKVLKTVLRQPHWPSAK
ncbi:MAG: long-chain-fatty-acid--CoA ligase [Burkholderiales bacterium]